MVLGCYYLTKAKKGAKGEGRAFATMDDVLLALEVGEVETLTPIRLLFSGQFIDLTTAFDDQDVVHAEIQDIEHEVVDTTVGRVIFNQQYCRCQKSIHFGPLVFSPVPTEFVIFSCAVSFGFSS